MPINNNKTYFLYLRKRHHKFSNSVYVFPPILLLFASTFHTIQSKLPCVQNRSNPYILIKLNCLHNAEILWIKVLFSARACRREET